MTHRDLLRLAHPAQAVNSGSPTLDVSAEHQRLFSGSSAAADGLPRIVEGFTRAQAAATASHTAELVREYGLPREALRSEHLTSPQVWEALLDDMPATALIRNLATMTRVSVLTPRSSGTATVVTQLGDRERLRRARAPDRGACGAADLRLGPRRPWTGHVEPGGGGRGRARRRVLRDVRERRAGRRISLLALDVSGSMTHGSIAGVPRLTPRDASTRAGPRDSGSRLSASSPVAAAGRRVVGGTR